MYREEFKKTIKAKPMFWPRFINEWEAYYQDLSKDEHVYLSTAIDYRWVKTYPLKTKNC